jgi:hypothetical protein
MRMDVSRQYHGNLLDVHLQVTVDVMSAKFLLYMTRIQSPVIRDSCGYNFTQYETPCTGCQAAHGSMVNQVVTTRNVSYIPIIQ